MATVVRVSEMPSQRVERYELLAELAAGGMATVYLARLGGAGGFQRLYAIKRLHPHLAHEREFVEMFLDEARLAARIHHPNVVPILEVGQADSGYFLVMEYIEGETLARLLGRSASRGEKIPTRIGAKIVLDTLAGLEAAHDLRDDFGEPLNIVHRDVSPQNVMVGVDGTGRITDFGVARAATRLTTTRAGQLKGKLGYMAPEQALGDDVDLRADVFAMGVILWETLTGRRLFKGKPDAPDAQTLNRLLYEPVPKLLDTDPSIPWVFEALCDRALERDPDKRFPSCGAFAEALEKVMQEAGGIASAREVAAFVDSVAGPEIEAQREAVRNWVGRSEVSVIDRSDAQAATMPATPSYHTSPFDLASSARKPVVLGQEQPPPRSRAGWIVAGALAIVLAVAVGGASVFLLDRQATPASSAPPSTTVAAAPVEPLPTAKPATSASTAAASSASDSASDDVTVPVAPEATRTGGSRTSDRNGRDTPPAATGKTDPKGPGTEKPPPDDPPSDDLNTNPYRQ